MAEGCRGANKPHGDGCMRGDGGGGGAGSIFYCLCICSAGTVVLRCALCPLCAMRRGRAGKPAKTTTTTTATRRRRGGEGGKPAVGEMGGGDRVRCQGLRAERCQGRGVKGGRDAGCCTGQRGARGGRWWCGPIGHCHSLPQRIKR